jgi:hypothetical protein
MGEFRVKRIKLYSQILEFEAQLVCYFSLNKVEQTVRDMIKYDSWDGMVENIQKMGQLSEGDRQIIDAERMKAGFEKLESGIRDALNELSCISKSIENEFSERRHQREGNVPGNSDNIKALSHHRSEETRYSDLVISPRFRNCANQHFK